jgi:hypothetical protein
MILEGARKAGLPEMTGAIAGIGPGMRVLNIGRGRRGRQLSIEGKASIWLERKHLRPGLPIRLRLRRKWAYRTIGPSRHLANSQFDGNTRVLFSASTDRASAGSKN